MKFLSDLKVQMASSHMHSIDDGIGVMRKRFAMPLFEPIFRHAWQTHKCNVEHAPVQHVFEQQKDPGGFHRHVVEVDRESSKLTERMRTVMWFALFDIPTSSTRSCT